MSIEIPILNQLKVVDHGANWVVKKFNDDEYLTEAEEWDIDINNAAVYGTDELAAFAAKDYIDSQ